MSYVIQGQGQPQQIGNVLHSAPSIRLFFISSKWAQSNAVGASLRVETRLRRPEKPARVGPEKNGPVSTPNQATSLLRILP